MEQVSERALRISEEIIRRTTTDHYRLVLNEEREPSIMGSKIGGKPYWPADMEYPVDNKTVLPTFSFGPKAFPASGTELFSRSQILLVPKKTLSPRLPFHSERIERSILTQSFGVGL